MPAPAEERRAGFRIRAAIEGSTASATGSESATAVASAIESEAKNCPATPPSIPSGRKTTTVVTVVPTTGQNSSSVPRRAASAGGRPASRWRCTASTITTASSITRPTAMANPPSDMRFSVWPKSRSVSSVMPSVSGNDSAATSVARRSRRKRASTITANRAPKSTASRTPRTASDTNSACS